MPPERLVRQACQSGAQVFVLGLPDLGRLPSLRPYADWIRVGLAAWQAAIKQIAARHGATVIDLTHYSSEIDRYPHYLCGDGFHPSQHGYRRIAEVVAEAVTARLSSQRRA